MSRIKKRMERRLGSAMASYNANKASSKNGGAGFKQPGAQKYW